MSNVIPFPLPHGFASDLEAIRMIGAIYARAAYHAETTPFPSDQKLKKLRIEQLGHLRSATSAIKAVWGMVFSGHDLKDLLNAVETRGVLERPQGQILLGEYGVFLVRDIRARLAGDMTAPLAIPSLRDEFLCEDCKKTLLSGSHGPGVCAGPPVPCHAMHEPGEAQRASAKGSEDHQTIGQVAVDYIRTRREMAARNRMRKIRESHRPEDCEKAVAMALAEGDLVTPEAAAAAPVTRDDVIVLLRDGWQATEERR